MTADGIRCMLMRGGTSKGAYFLASDLPADPAERDDLLLRIMGSPDPRQIDGLGGAHPLTSKVAVVSPSTDPDIDVDYLFLQVVVDEAVVTDRQNCGNILAGIGPFAVERGLVTAAQDRTRVRIRMVNTGGIATAEFATPGGAVDYDGGTAIDGVPGTAGAISLDFEGTAGSSTGALFPTGATADDVDGIRVTCVDNGMPSVLIRASDLGLEGDEDPEALEADKALAERLERIRLAAGERMGLGDVSEATVPKMVLLSAPRSGGAIATRSFLPHRVHTSIGVLGALTVAAGVLADGSVGRDLARLPAPGDPFAIEHPTGHFDVDVAIAGRGDGLVVERSAALRTARKIMDGTVFPRPRT
ncbi:4-oxalomesaconate tautomerase [Microbacterium paludicola]|uniref:4-oxalomesaconate tautomerase n=1 Tax=Microbacterium paludicola TaxID=300019 RepID=A0A4Y9FW80_9MICO|nr:4-oxalomesaconate tautomerase [Microbacterium paludicola]MBF0816188.1 4-oxalomesaconate tautomerase [Microbacterium paludicola]TFU33126.1 4-oxalomesaconate tautomerase [Microbacterium paludicola]